MHGFIQLHIHQLLSPVESEYCNKYVHAAACTWGSVRRSILFVWVKGMVRGARYEKLQMVTHVCW